MTKTLILDSGTLITLSMNGFLYIIPELKKKTSVRFAITEMVKYESTDRPIRVPRFELGALRIKALIDSKNLELPPAFNIQQQAIKAKTQELMNIANQSLKANGKWLKIVSDAEMSCLALSSLLAEKETESMIAIDERTTRILAEKPQNLQKITSKKFHQNVELVKKNFPEFSEFKFIRSTELVYVAHKLGVLKVKGPKALEAALFATKFKGSSVSYDEINVLKKL